MPSEGVTKSTLHRSIVRSWRQSSTHTESWTTSSGRNLLSVQIGLSEVPIMLIQQSFWPSILATIYCLRSTATWSSSWIWTTHGGLELATSRHLSKVFPSSNHLILPLFRTRLGTVSRVSAKEAKENLCTHPVEHSQIQTCHAHWPFFHRPAKDRAWFLRKELVRSPKRNISQTSSKSVYKLYLQKMLQVFTITNYIQTPGKNNSRKKLKFPQNGIPTSKHRSREADDI